MSEHDRILRSMTDQVAAFAPKAFLVLAMVLGGIALSWAAKRLVGVMVRRSGLEAALERVGASKLMYKVGLRDGFKPVAEAVAWYGGLLITVATLAEALGLTGLREGIGVVIAFLPRLSSAVVLLLGGLWVAGLLRALVDKLGKQGKDADASTALGQVVYGLVLTVTVTIALDQLGLEVQLLSSLMQIVLAAAALAMALAFALGGRSVFENLIARHYYKALVRPGDRVRAGGVQGTVIRVSPVAVIIASDHGELVVPCSMLMSGVTEIRRLGGTGDGSEVESPQ